MKTSPSIAAIAAALAKTQGEIRNAGRDAANPFFKSKYAPLDTVIDAFKPALSKNGIAYFQSATADGPKVSLVTVLMHSSGEWIETDPLTATGKDAGAQTVGSVCTYLRRYGLMAAVGIAATDDDDAEAGEGRQTQTAQPTPREPPKSRVDAVKEKVATANGHKPTPVDAFKIEALKEATAMFSGDDAEAKKWLRSVRGDPDGKRPWTEKDVETVKAQITLMRAQKNVEREFGLEN